MTIGKYKQQNISMQQTGLFLFSGRKMKRTKVFGGDNYQTTEKSIFSQWIPSLRYDRVRYFVLIQGTGRAIPIQIKVNHTWFSSFLCCLFFSKHCNFRRKDVNHTCSSLALQPTHCLWHSCKGQQKFSIVRLKIALNLDLPVPRGTSNQ